MVSMSLNMLGRNVNYCSRLKECQLPDRNNKQVKSARRLRRSEIEDCYHHVTMLLQNL